MDNALGICNHKKVKERNYDYAIELIAVTDVCAGQEAGTLLQFKLKFYKEHRHFALLSEFRLVE